MLGIYWYHHMALALVILSVLYSSHATDSPPCQGEGGATGSYPREQTGKYRLNDLHELSTVVSDPQNICYLDLSNGNLTILPPEAFSNFSNLITLSLASNKIRTIPQGAFIGLKHLQNLNLSMNQITTFDTTNTSQDMPSLRTLDMTGNDWSPSNELLQQPSLYEVRGVSWSSHCRNCSLVRPQNASKQLENFKDDKYLVYLKGYPCRAREFTVKGIPRTFAKYGFVSDCLEEDTKCFNSEVPSEITYPCWDVTRQVGGMNYLFGPVAIVLNLCIVITTLWSARLRRNVSMMLVANLASADLLNGLYSVSITAVRQQRSFHQMLEFTRTSCKFLGFPWMLATEVAVNTLFVLAIERFLSIVYSTKPKYRMTPRSCLVGLAVIWVYSLLISILPLAGIADYSITLFCVPVYPVKSIPAQFWYSFYVTGTVALTYLVTIPMYVRLYRTVKTSGLRMGKRNDVTLAKRIFILVMCNMFFFFLPVAISLIWSWSGTLRSISRVTTDVLTSAFSIVCLTISSALNPGLYAFQSSSFRDELRSLYRKIIGKAIRLRGQGESSASGPSTSVTLRDNAKSSASAASIELIKYVTAEDGSKQEATKV